MSMTLDGSHEALDINIGRALEMYLADDISLSKTKLELMRFFGVPSHSARRADLEAYLTLLLEQVKCRDLEAGDVRSDLVRMAVLAQSHDADFAALIQRGED